MSNPWKKVTETVEVQNLSDIMSEEYAKGLQVKEELRFATQISDSNLIETENEIDQEILRQMEKFNVSRYCDSDAVIAKVLQCQFNKEYNDELKRVEKKRNGDAKVTLSYNKYFKEPEHLWYESDSEDDTYEYAYDYTDDDPYDCSDDNDTDDDTDLDHFETNEKEYASLPKRGFIMKDGEMVTKHDSVINGRRNACRVMAFPPEVCTGDGAGFDMKLPNSVFNQLKEHTRWNQARKHKMLDRKESQATAEKGLDEATRLIIFKLINNGILEEINGVISTGKESVVLHSNSGSVPDMKLPKECAIKVFKTTLNEFKTRDKYIEADYRFKDRFSKQNPRKIAHMWAEKEMHNMMRIQKIGLNCPEMVILKKHILVMSFIGKENKPAPKLKDVILKPEKWQNVYAEVVDAMYKLYNVGHLVHADLSEYNILWWDKKCWLIDVSQSVQPDHPNGLKFLLRDCRNIINFFEKKGVPDIKTSDELFKYITGFEEIDVNMLEGVHTTYNSLSCRFEIALDDNRNTSYPFEYCWQKTTDKQAKSDKSGDKSEDEFDEMWEYSKQIKPVDVAPNFGNEIKITDNIILDKETNFCNTIGMILPERSGGISSDIDKKS